MRVLQLGNAPALPASVINYRVPGVMPVPAPPKVSTGTKILNTVNQLLPTVVQTKQTVDILRNKPAQPGITNTSFQPGAGLQPPPRVGLSTGAKVGIGVAGALVVGGIIYAVTRKKKSN